MMPPTGYEDWLAGLIDGEATFYITKTGEIRFSLGLRDDDEAVLLEVVERTGIGRIERREHRTTSNPQVVWQVTTRKSVAALIELLDAHPLRTKKQVDYLLWREAAMLWLAEHRHGKGQGKGVEKFTCWPEVERLRVRMNTGRRYSRG